MLLKRRFSEVCIGAEFMLGSDDFRKEDETKAKNLNDGLFEFFGPDIEVYVVKKIYLKHLF